MMKLSVSRYTQKALLAGSLFVLLCVFSKAYGQRNATTAKWFEEKTWLNGLQLTPHHTIDQQEFRKQYEANPGLWNKAFAYLKETNLSELKPGKYQIDGDNVYALVTEGLPKSADTAKWEGHHQYIDIHHVISGRENMGLAPVTQQRSSHRMTVAKTLAFTRQMALSTNQVPPPFSSSSRRMRIYRV